MSTESLSCHVGELTLRYWVSGSGPQNIVVLHGTASDHGTWDPVLAGLGELGTVYAPDLRGHGFSGRASHYRFVDFVPDVIRFIEQSVRGPVLLIGHSSGGIVALNIAGNRPDLVTGVIAEEPPLFILDWFQESVWPQVFSDAVALAGNSVESVTESLVLQGQDRSRALQRAFGLAHVDAKVFHPLLNLTMFDGYPTEAILGSIACPTLILHDFDAPGSGLRPPTLAKAMAILSAAHVTHIAGAGHSIHSSNPGAFLNEISLFASALN